MFWWIMRRDFIQYIKMIPTSYLVPANWDHINRPLLVANFNRFDKLLSERFIQYVLKICLEVFFPNNLYKIYQVHIEKIMDVI